MTHSLPYPNTFRATALRQSVNKRVTNVTTEDTINQTDVKSQVSVKNHYQNDNEVKKNKTYRYCPTLITPISADQGIVVINHPNPDATVFLCFDNEGLTQVSHIREKRLDKHELAYTLWTWFESETGLVTAGKVPQSPDGKSLTTICQAKISHPNGAGHIVLSAVGDGLIMHHFDNEAIELDLPELRAILADWFGGV